MCSYLSFVEILPEKVPITCLEVVSSLFILVRTIHASYNYVSGLCSGYLTSYEELSLLLHVHKTTCDADVPSSDCALLCFVKLLGEEGFSYWLWDRSLPLSSCYTFRPWRYSSTRFVWLPCKVFLILCEVCDLLCEVCCPAHAFVTFVSCSLWGSQLRSFATVVLSYKSPWRLEFVVIQICKPLRVRLHFEIPLMLCLEPVSLARSRRHFLSKVLYLSHGVLGWS